MPDESSSGFAFDIPLEVLATKSGFRSLSAFLEQITRGGEALRLSKEDAEVLERVRRKLGFENPASPRRDG